jgi:hypothetical protein
LITEDTLEVLEIARFWKLGQPPTTCGGAGFIDQTESIIRACGVVWNEQEKWKAHHAKQGRIDFDGMR